MAALFDENRVQRLGKSLLSTREWNQQFASCGMLPCLLLMNWYSKWEQGMRACLQEQLLFILSSSRAQYMISVSVNKPTRIGWYAEGQMLYHNDCFCNGHFCQRLLYRMKLLTILTNFISIIENCSPIKISAFLLKTQ